MSEFLELQDCARCRKDTHAHGYLPNHYYVEKLLGNLIGLGRLMSFVARETDLKVGALTVVSTHAQIDQPNGRRRSDIGAMIAKFDHAAAPLAA
jgi:hypothetical protein